MKETPEYKKVGAGLENVPWIINGSVIKQASRSPSARGRSTYKWTRKVKGKTVTVSLSKEQYNAFRQAIAANKKVEDTLKKMRTISAQNILKHTPGVKKRTPRKTNI